MTTAELLKTIRIKHNLTQSELGDRIGVNAACISQVEQGHRAMPLWWPERLEKSGCIPPKDCRRIKEAAFKEAAMADPALSAWGRLVMGYRVQHGETRRALADAIGTAPQSISRWERGLAKVSAQVMQQIADHYHLSNQERRQMEQAAMQSRKMRVFKASACSSGGPAKAGRLLREMRTRARMTQQELGEAMQVNSHSISMVECGRKELPLWWLDRLEKSGCIPSKDCRRIEEALLAQKTAQILKSNWSAWGKCVGQLLAEHRQTAAALAQAVGVSANTLSRWQTGRANVPDKAVQKIADHYQLSEQERQKLAAAAAQSRRPRAPQTSGSDETEDCPKRTGRFIKDIRTANNLTQAELARLLAVGARFVGQVERGVRVMPASWIARLQQQELVDQTLADELHNALHIEKLKGYAQASRLQKKAVGLLGSCFAQIDDKTAQKLIDLLEQASA